MKKTLLILISSYSILVMPYAYSQENEPSVILPTVSVIAQSEFDRLSSFGVTLKGEALNERQFANSDAATLLGNISGVNFYTGGGVSSLPVINGLGDDRLKITVDGMRITSACPNHMNPALSYVNPAALEQINVYAGVTPVSQGGDSIGGSIVLKSRPPEFAKQGEGVKASGNITAFHRSNGNVNSASVRGNAATEKFSIGYVGNTVDADNYKDGKGREVVASRYRVRNNKFELAALLGSDVWNLDIGWQDIPFQGYPNQSMDMTSNKSLSFNLGYNGHFNWGKLEGNTFHQRVRHKMDVLQDKAAAAGFTPANSYMPMDTDAVDLGYSVVGTVPLKDNHKVRIGNEFHRYKLDDWWPPLAGSMMMGPDTFLNINSGRRDRLAIFSELDSKFTDKLSTQIGARLEHVEMNTGDVQGYYAATSMLGDAYETDASSFNNKNHKRKDLNLDLTFSGRYINSANETYDMGVSRKTRSPNLYERYTWSNEAMMAGLMNNWFGDLNSYVGNIDLKPEVAYTFKASADWHDAENRDWQVSIKPFYTYIKDYINATQNTSSNMYNMNMIAGRKSLTFINEDAQLYGVDISGKKRLGKAYGEWMLRSNLSYNYGKTTNGDGLYNIMPLNGRLAIDHKLKKWSNTLEALFISSKDSNLSVVRGEQATAGYSLVNFLTSYQIKKFITLSASIDNLFNRHYRLPLGGLEYVSGNMMTSPNPLRGMGRSINFGVSINF